MTGILVMALCQGAVCAAHVLMMHWLKQANDRSLARGEDMLEEMKLLDESRADNAGLLEAQKRDDKLISELRHALDAAQKELSHARVEAVVTAAPDDIGGVVDRMLEDRATRARFATDHDDTQVDPVPGPGAAADSPVPDSAFR